MKYIKEIHHIKAEQEIEKLLDEAILELLEEETSLFERSESRSSNKYNFDNNSTKWSETLVGKLFKKITNIITLNGLLTGKIKDVIGVKSNLIKRLANKLEEKIDLLPAEYLTRSNEVDLATRKLSYYDEMKKYFSTMTPQTSIETATSATNKLITLLPDLLKDLDTSKSEAYTFSEEVNQKLKSLKSLKAKIEKLDINKQHDFSRMASTVADKNDIVSKSTELAAQMKDSVKSAAEDTSIGSFTSSEKKGGKVSGATKSMYDIVAIVNKAYDLFTYDDDSDDDDDYRKGSSRKRDNRLFKIWEDRVMQILSVKSDILPEPLKKYIGSSLQKDFRKYKTLPGENSKNVLDEINNIDNVLVQAKKKKDTMPETDAVSSEKSTAMSFGYRKMDKGLYIQENQFKNSPVVFKFSSGTYTEGSFVYDLTKTILVLMPADMTGPNIFTAVLTPSDDMFDNMRTTTGVPFNSDTMKLETIGQFVETESSKAEFRIRTFYYAVVTGRKFGQNSKIEMHCYKPSNLDAPQLGKPHATVVGTLEAAYGTFGTDGRIMYLDPTEVKKMFNTTSANFKALTQHYKTSKELA